MSVKAEIVKVGGIALEYCMPGGEPNHKHLLLVHSAGHGSWMWKNFLPYFAERGYCAWAINLRGHYLSDPVEDWEAVGVAAYLEDIGQAADHLGDSVVLVGHSMSGLLILKYAEAHRVAGLIVSQSGLPKSMMLKRGIELTGSRPGKDKLKMQGGAIMPIEDREWVKALLFDKGNVTEESVALVLQMMGMESARVGAELMQMELLPEKITAPLYVLGFDASKIGMTVPVDLNKVLAEELKARDYAIIEPGGHNYMLEKNWQVFAQQFEAWIAAL